MMAKPACSEATLCIYVVYFRCVSYSARYCFKHMKNVTRMLHTFPPYSDTGRVIYATFGLIVYHSEKTADYRRLLSIR